MFKKKLNFEHSSKRSYEFFRDTRATVIGILIIATLSCLLSTILFGGGILKLGFHYFILLAVPWSMLLCLGFKNVRTGEYGAVYWFDRVIFGIDPGIILIIPWLFRVERFNAEIIQEFGGLTEIVTAYPKTASDQEDVKKYVSSPLNNSMPVGIDYCFDNQIDGLYGLCEMISKFGSLEKATANAKTKINMVLGEVASGKTPAQILGGKTKVDTELNKKLMEMIGRGDKKHKSYLGISIDNLKTFKPVIDPRFLQGQKEIIVTLVDQQRQIVLSETARKSMIILSKGERAKSINEAEAKRVWLEVEAYGIEVAGKAKALTYELVAKAAGVSVIELELQLKIMGEALKSSNYTTILGSEGFSSLLGFWPVLKDTVSRMSASMGGKGGNTK